MTLTQICRKWREIALGTPALWSVLSYDDDIRQVHVFNAWLNRSRSCPLSLNLRRGVRGLDITPVLTAMVPHRARWERLQLDFLSQYDLPIFNGPMPLLRYLKLHLHRPPADAIAAVLFDAPLLRTVILNAHATSKVILPWAQLTSLALIYVFPHQCVPILQQTSNLVRCELHIFFDPNRNHRGPDVTLAHLESLILISPGRESVPDFLETLIVPALRRLEVPECFLDAKPIELLTVFISKSGCKLEELLVTSGSVPLSSYCTAFPSIRNISSEGRSIE
ncbi:hypothetical protein B0H13DRAFT_2277894 [Mycena leptocephala]|nr:hypothetical protein B0H13DRAFT_2277894 [Mycena leptocephala]